MKGLIRNIFLGLMVSEGGNMLAQEHHVKTQKDTLFFDDFSGETLDREKWNVMGTDFWVNNEQQIYYDSTATVFNVKGAEAEGVENALILKAHYSPDFINYKG
ncbi:MAG TPA: glycoside hydrolase family 16 protein, partial [Salinimicrobium catena]|nr:glycoside hydrolase family 16 protein [Salinimicrobium catena]